MRKTIAKIALLGGILLALSITASAQLDRERSSARTILDKTAKTGVVVVGTGAKYTWKATKFTAGKVVKPVVVKAAPATGKFVLRQTGRVAKKSVPLVRKFAVTYLKFRIGL